MRRLSGQAARLIWTLLHGTVAVLMTAAMIGGLGLGVLAWRLGRGPVVLPWLPARIEAAADPSLAPARLTVGQAALTWEGFHGGMGAPIAVRLSDVALRTRDGAARMAVPRAVIALSIPALLRLRLAPSVVVLDGPALILRRAADGSIGFAIGGAPVAPSPSATGPEAAEPPLFDPGTILGELARPPAGARTPNRFGLFSQLRQVEVRNADLTVIDRGLGTVWRAPGTRVVLARAPDGGVIGRATVGLVLGGTVARLTLGATLPPGGTTARITIGLAPVMPAALAGAAPALAPLAALAAPVGGTASGEIGAHGRPGDMRLDLTAGAGEVRVASGVVPILGATLAADATATVVTIDRLRLTLPGVPGTAPTALTLRGSLARDGAGYTAAFGLGFDRVDFARLPALWPAGLAWHARRWVLDNIPRGEASDGAFTFGLRAGPGFADPHLFEAAGQLRGTGLEVHWLRPIPPLTGGVAELRLVTPDRMDIVVSTARQSMPPGVPAGLIAQSGVVRITGLSQKDQFARIETRITGPLAAAIALLNEPKLNLLARHPVPLHDPAGQVSVGLVLNVPLNDDLQLSQIGIGVTARLTAVHLARIAAGRDLDDGQIDLVADPDRLSVSGDGRWAGIPAHFDGHMDFRAGPAGQVQEHLTARAATDAVALAKAGLPLAGMVTGPVGVTAEVTERRGGAGLVALRGDLTGARVTVAPVGWTKPAGAAAGLSVDLPLLHDQLEGTAPIALSGAASGRGTARFVAGRLARLTVAGLRVGGSDLAGEAAVPGGSAPIAVRVTGRMLDLAARFATTGTGENTVPPPGVAKSNAPPGAAKPPPPQPGPAWTLDGRVATVRLAGGERLANVVAQGTNDGLVWRQLALDATEPVAGPAPRHVRLRIAPAGAGRRLDISADDTGSLARGLGLPVRLTGGRLAVTGTFAPGPEGALSGTATVTDFRLRDAPAVARVLQAVTLYGLVEIMQGPGLGVTRLTAPFALDGSVLTLKGARAFSSSVGATTEGTIDLTRGTINVKGTIVPAYFFNTLLGRLPIVGRLFSPEPGGGLFAASYTVTGTTKDPDVSVNPLTALTPGFLRGLFGLF